MSTARSSERSVKARVPAVDGWFTLDERSPALLGSRCASCGTYFFPVRHLPCANPRCGAAELETVPLSRRGRVWSYTDARYPPPPPFVQAEPYEPFALAAVELAAEKLVVLGQVTRGLGAGELGVGDEVELVLETLYEDDEHDYVVWKWRPVQARREAS